VGAWQRQDGLAVPSLQMTWPFIAHDVLSPPW
jgi:hypothetical protein